MRADLVETVRSLLSRTGFAVSDVFRERPLSFDFLARRDENLYIIKVLTNVDSLSEDVASEMRVLARFLEGQPLLVGLRSSAGELEAGAVYLRHHIPILSLEGLEEYILEGAAPVAMAMPGGLCVRLDAHALRSAREDRGLSLGHLANVAGVSRRAIAMYEAGMGATVEAALRLEEYLEAELIEPIDPFAPRRHPWPEAEATKAADIEDPYARSVLDHLQALGLGIVPTSRAPFSAIGLLTELELARSRALLLVAHAEAAMVRQRQALLSSVSRVTERTAVFLVEDEGEPTQGTVMVRRRELKDLTDAGSFADLIEEKRADAD